MGQTHSSRADGAHAQDAEAETFMELYFNKTIEAKTNIGAGIGLFAQEDFEPGDVIIQLQNPFLCILQQSAFADHCFYCFQPVSRPSKCTGCNVAGYCGKSCQVASWQTDHKHECKLFRACMEQHGEVVPTPTRALMLILLKIKNESKDELVWSEKLTSHCSAFMQDRENMESFRLQARMAVHLAKVPAALLDMSIEIFCQLKINAFRLNTADDTPIGLCFDPLLARMNHSCWPNAFLSFDGRATTVRALHPIKASREILVSYIDPTVPRTNRESRLQSRYKFTCSCPKCIKDMSVYDIFLESSEDLIRANEDALAQSTTQLVDSAKESASCWENLKDVNYNTLVGYSDLKLRRLGIANQLRGLKQTLYGHSMANYPYPDIMHTLYDDYLEQKEYAAATVIRATLVYAVEPFQFPEPWHPVRVTSLFALAKLLHLTYEEPAYALGLLASVSPNFLECYRPLPTILSLLLLVNENVGKSHGLDTHFATEVRDKLSETERAVRLLAHNGGDSTGIAILDRGFAPGTPGRKTAKDLWKLLALLANPRRVLMLADECVGPASGNKDSWELIPPS